MRSLMLGRAAATAGLLLLGSGCNALDRFEDGGATVFVFATHHATPEDGAFPNRGGDDMPRSFENAEGWSVTLLEAYVTISSVTLIGCNGAEYPLRMFWGPCPEDLRDEDLATLTVAGSRVDDGNYCTLRVEYDAYMPPIIDDEADDTRHQVPTNDAVQGASVYLLGGARLGDGDNVPFEIVSPETITVDLDLSNIEGPGRALNIAHREDFPKELLVSKTYDRFFDGVNFDAFEPGDVEDRMPQMLADETRVSLGTVVSIDDGPMAPVMDGG